MIKKDYLKTRHCDPPAGGEAICFKLPLRFFTSPQPSPQGEGSL